MNLQQVQPGRKGKNRYGYEQKFRQPWFKTRGGEDSTDSIFLLSLEEVCEYFSGDSRAKYGIRAVKHGLSMTKTMANARQNIGKDFHWWRLRSPGYYERTAASVSDEGYVYVRLQNRVYGRPKDSGGVRPALWLSWFNSSE